jgi:alpha-galactosidase
MMTSWSRTLLVALLLLFGFGPASPASPIEEWARVAFLGAAEEAKPFEPGLEVRRQDHGSLELRRSVLKTPMRIGEKAYEHGLGTHSVSEIVVHLPQPGRTFESEVGIDNNKDTAGAHGSAAFVVQIGGREVFRSDVRRGGQAPQPVKVDLNGAEAFTLRVLDGGDGENWDQSDWADAIVTLADGARKWLDEMPVLIPPIRLSTELPFSFTYGGKSSSELLPKWKRMLPRQPPTPGKQLDWTIYEDPETKLQVTCELRRFDDFPAVEWVLRLTNAGSADTPIIENIRPLDLHIAAPPACELTLHHAHGSTAEPTDFLPIETRIEPNSELKYAPNGGRSSDGHMPFFNLQWQGGGLLAAIGWSGQWCCRFHRDGRDLELQAGQQFCSLRLQPGESIRTPRILLIGYEAGDWLRGNNLLRRLLLAHYVPRVRGEITIPPLSQNTWFVYNSGNGVTEANQIATIRQMRSLGLEVYWLDAGWFEGGWPAGAGSWYVRKDAFPRGLRPVSEAARAEGLKFLLWFEPERVNPTSRIAKDHPEWVLHTGGGDGLFNLGDRAARDWLTNHLSNCIRDWGIDIYRNDFNIDPLPFWQKADPPERQGITEIRYIEGLYAMWDALRERHPDMPIDDCASGGRRIDLEMMTRSYPLTRSDSVGAMRPMPVWDQVQTAGLSLFAPLNASLLFDCETYAWRSVATMGAGLCQDTLKAGFDREQARRAIEEAQMLRPMQLGDFYPLLDINLDEHHWCAWQYDRPELGKGYAMFFRREKSPYRTVSVEIKAVEATAKYELSFVDSNQTRTLSGRELQHLSIDVETRPGSALVLYKKLK